jgi:hypothetical protein
MARSTTVPTDETRVWCADYGRLIRLNETVDPESREPRLEVMVDDTETELAVALDLDGVRNLRLALQRYERSHR